MEKEKKIMTIAMDTKYIKKSKEYLERLDYLRPYFLEDDGKYTYTIQTKTEAEELRNNIVSFQKELEKHLIDKVDELKNQYMIRNHCTYENIPSEIINAHFGGEGQKIYDKIMYASEELAELLYKRW